MNIDMDVPHSDLTINSIWPCVLVCQVFQNEVPYMGWLKLQNYIFSQFCELEVQDQGCAGLISSEAALMGLQMAMALCVFTWPSLCVCLHPTFSCKDTSEIGLGPTLRASF